MPMPEGDAKPINESRDVSSEGSPPAVDLDNVMSDIGDDYFKTDEMPSSGDSDKKELSTTTDDRFESDPLKVAQQTREKLTEEATDPEGLKDLTKTELAKFKDADKNVDPEKGYENIKDLKTKGQGDQSGAPNNTDNAVDQNKDKTIDMTPR